MVTKRKGGDATGLLKDKIKYDCSRAFEFLYSREISWRVRRAYKRRRTQLLDVTPHDLTHAIMTRIASHGALKSRDPQLVTKAKDGPRKNMEEYGKF